MCFSDLTHLLARVPLHQLSLRYAQKNGGRLCVLGSTELFADEWLNKEQNNKLLDVLVTWLVGDAAGTGITVELDAVDAEDPDINDYHYLPDTQALADRLRSCLQESEDLPKDFTQLFDDTLFKFDTNLIPETVKLYSVREPTPPHAASERC